jgi:deoxyxylulose-5-phosphate synthase
MSDDEPYYISEHRKSYDNTSELNDIFENETPDFTIFPISITRFEMQKLVEILNDYEIKINISNLMWIKPLKVSDISINSLKNSKYGGLVLDDDYSSGCQSHIANQLSISSNKIVRCLGLDDKTAGFYNNVDVLPPTAQKIADYLINIKNQSEGII